MRLCGSFLVICILTLFTASYSLLSHPAVGQVSKTSFHGGNSHAPHRGRPVIRRYFRGEGRFRTFNYTSDDDSDEDDSSEEASAEDLVLEYGQRYKGLGRLSTPEECARTCKKGARPKTCYYHFTVEHYRTLGGACNLCQPTTNTSLTSDCQCIQADGVDVSGIMVVNRMYPGPSIQVCLGDLVVIDVHNKATGTTLTIHWHGIYQKDYQYYDGVPYVTQCPIQYLSTFRYKWRAQNAGTHFYHAHTGLHKPDGVEGAIVIRTPPSEDPNREYYDEDGFDNIIFLNDWFHESAVDHWPGTSIRNVGQIPENFLINGKGQWFDADTGTYTDAPLAIINVKPNRRYRFRLINSLSWTCSVRFTIQNHTLTVIGTDGEDVKPKDVNTITSFSAERFDFILDTNQPVSTYWIQLRGLGACASQNLTQVAILRYIGSGLEEPEAERPLYNPGLPLGTILNDLNQVCNGSTPNVVCIKDLESTDEPNERILAEKADYVIYLPFQFYTYSDEELYEPNTYKTFQVPGGGNGSVALLSNISNSFPPSPYLSQIDDVPSERICNGRNLPRICRREKPCFCSHIIDLELNAVVEIIMTDAGPNGLSHPFHLHGYGFHVLAQGLLTDVNITSQNKYEALELNRRFYGKPCGAPPVKDTLATPTNGYTIVRFIADNPGYWLYHCHFMSHLLVGMELVFHVGEQSDLPPIPDNFPTCGNYRPKVRYND